MLFRTAFTTLRASLRLAVLARSTTPCDFMEEYSFCMAISSITLPAVKVVSFSYILITAERSIALLYAKSYETQRQIPIVLIVVALTWYGLPEAVSGAWPGFFRGDSGQLLPYCASTTVGAITMWTIVEWTVPVNILSASALLVLHVLLRRKAKLSLLSTPVLSSRYELRSSLKSLRFLLPNVALCCAISVFMQITTVVMIFVPIHSLHDYALFKETYSALIFPLQYLSFPIICLWRNEELRPYFLQKHPTAASIVAAEKMDPKDAMDHIQNVWEMHSIKRIPS
ncbi:unnamed protein product, partial [Mesorhabditis spiculigera]